MVWWPAGPAHALSVAVAVLIVTCPCALSLATPAATLAAAGALARRGVLVRHLQTLEAAAAIDTVVFDKTGTLTLDRMDLVATHCRPGVSADQALAAAAALGAASRHPLSRALVEAAAPPSARGHAQAEAGNAIAPPDVALLSEVLELAGQGVRARLVAGREVPTQWHGALLRLGSASFCDARPVEGAHAQVHLADEAGWIATFELREQLREDAAAAIAALRAQGLQVRLLSGDRADAVAALAGRLGIQDWEAGCTPEAKLATLRELQGQGRRVLMVGDGMNDAPVLALADVSVAMGEGVPLARARADVVAQGARLSAVPALVAQARRSWRIVRQNLWWAAFYNAACIPLAILGLMPAWLAGLGMAASSLLVVTNAARLSRLPESA